MKAAHVARGRIEAQYQIEFIRGSQQEVEIEWQDGHRSTFHTIWLRDNCSCDKCGDHSGGHRFFELNMLSLIHI